MFDNKFYTVMLVISFVLLAVVVAFQYMEMDKFGIINELIGSAQGK
ncbi:MAG: hypothetical protein AB7F40_11795 [Victivallaceae bacterium]|nr:hypothetical protein [Victivallaceae bacterium]